MNPWMLLLVLGMAFLIAILLRGPQPVKGPPSREEGARPPRQDDEPPVVRPAPPRRRIMPVPAVQRLVRAEPPPLPQLVPVVALAAPVSTPRKKPSPVALQLVEMLKNPQSLQAAVLLREVLDPPLCRRRR